jgi:predicted nucleotidyltransferase
MGTSVDLNAAEFKGIVESLRRSAAALREAEVRYCLAGSVASWARGGPETVNDLDLIVHPPHLEQAVGALEGCGMRKEVPPEGWLVKMWDGDVLVDLIHTVTGYESVEEILERSEVMRVASIDIPVAQMEDVLTPKLLAFDEHYLDFTGALRASRALRERIDWDVLREKTQHSPYARGFFAMLEALEIIAGDDAPAPSPAPQR